MQQLLLIIHLFACISIVVLVLIQHGKGADAGAAFGGGASGTVFGSQGSGAFLLKLTTVIAAVFFSTSVGLAYLTSYVAQHRTVNTLMEEPEAAETVTTTEPGDAFVEPEQEVAQQPK